MDTDVELATLTSLLDLDELEVVESSRDRREKVRRLTLVPGPSLDCVRTVMGSLTNDTSVMTELSRTCRWAASGWCGRWGLTRMARSARGCFAPFSPHPSVGRFDVAGKLRCVHQRRLLHFLAKR